MPETKVICLTPCRNENWIIDIHLKAASQWADHIIVGDQISDDGTRDTVRRYPKACLVDNYGKGYDEGERHRVVFEAARQIPGRKILLAIDSDELLSANWIDSGEWQKLLCLPAGTAIYARWANILPGFKTWFAMGGPSTDPTTGYLPPSVRLARDSFATTPQYSGADVPVFRRTRNIIPGSRER